MANEVKSHFLNELTRRFGSLHKLNSSQSLFEVSDGAARMYVRYSKVHGRKQTFYGLRDVDLRRLQGHPSILCFLWDHQEEPLFIPFAEYEEIFHSVQPANDGQYKVQVYQQNNITELYIANAGRFNVESYYGWTVIEHLIDSSDILMPDLSHSQVQTLLGAIGAEKGYAIWIPPNDRAKMDWTIANEFPCGNIIPDIFSPVKGIIEEIDVIWIERGSAVAKAFFEVEHSTPIYSGLLRFNDVHLLTPDLGARFSVVANDNRRSLFVRQLNRPTFRMSGLCNLCNFLEYRNVFEWHSRLKLR